MCLKTTLGLYKQPRNPNKDFLWLFQRKDWLQLWTQSTKESKTKIFTYYLHSQSDQGFNTGFNRTICIKWTFSSDFSSSEYPKIRSSWWLESSWSVLKLSFCIRNGLVQGPACPPSKWETGNCPLFNEHFTNEPFLKMLQHQWLFLSNF